MQPIVRVRLTLGDLLTSELAGLDWVEAFDALRRVAVRHRAHFERMQPAKVGDLVE